ncbi:chemotaxis protein CheD [Colidextribacter sp. OB.20]|uniref:chemotaxis protein CheD n=1 Tax=Colidextribacter sp. OB.20 TaxID=2304568 RepID=UPI00136EFF57|nr:chemotaxis protein CheD [Colidextribacter sp. OB.20]NBI09996.1 chemotaxis protein CheD [Colidextribacter sp. OB.20]
MSEKKITVGIADMKIAKGDGILVTYALGSCIGLCFHDPRLRLGALLHIMLPLNLETGRTHPMKYADTGIKETLKQLEAQGASRARMTVKIAGGAKMFEVSGSSGLGNIGQRNIESVHTILKRENIRLVGEYTGGTVARTLLFDVVSGQGCIRSYGVKDIIF